MTEKNRSMAGRKKYLNVFELNQALERETMVNKALTSLLVEKGVFSSEELEKKIVELEKEQKTDGSDPLR